jgi:hypothetical protein
MGSVRRNVIKKSHAKPPSRKEKPNRLRDKRVCFEVIPGLTRNPANSHRRVVKDEWLFMDQLFMKTVGHYGYIRFMAFFRYQRVTGNS